LSGDRLHLVAWESTRACKFACKHCRATAQLHPDPKQLSTQEAKRLIDEIALIAKPVFIITGGDPLLRDDIFKIARYAVDREFHVAMALNGDVAPETASKIYSTGVRRVSLSIDGSKRAVHDNFRGIEGALKMAMQTVKSIKSAGLLFRILTTVTKYNLHDLGNLYNLAVDLGAECWDIFMLVPTGRATSEMEVSPTEYENVLRFAYDLSRRSKIPIRLTCAPQYNRILLQTKGVEGARAESSLGKHETGIGRGCMTGDGFCFISHIGEVYGCGYLPVSAGNIRQKTFSDIYNSSPLFLQLRDRKLLKGKCGVCLYQEVCGGCRARAYAASGDVLGEEPCCIYHPLKRDAA
jgi:radical SAM protein with 4Fe4S-binding SPASM domain